jgi:hypothetical protein
MAGGRDGLTSRIGRLAGHSACPARRPESGRNARPWRARPGEARQAGEEGLHGGRLLRHHSTRGFGRAARVPGQCQHEGTYAPAGAVLAADLIVDHGQRAGPVAGDRARQSEPPPDFIAVMRPHRELIITLGLRGIAGQIVGKAPIGGIFALRRAERAGLLEEAKRTPGLLHGQKCRPDARLDPAVPRGDLLGRAKTRNRRLRVAKGERGPCRARQRRQVARRIRQCLQVHGQGAARIRHAEGALCRCRPRQRKCAPARQQGDAQPELLAQLCEAHEAIKLQRHCWAMTMRKICARLVPPGGERVTLRRNQMQKPGLA